MATDAQELARRGRPQRIANSSNYPVAVPTAPQASPAPVPDATIQLLVPDMPNAAPVAYGAVQGISPCALGLCDEQAVTVTGGPTVGGGVFAAPQVVGDLSPQADAWYRRAAERRFGGRAISVPAAASEMAAAQVLGVMDNPAFAQRTAQLTPLIGQPAAAAQARGDVAAMLGLEGDYMASPAYGADQRLLETAQAQAQARAAAAGVYDQLGVWNDLRPNAQALVPVNTAQGPGVSIPRGDGTVDVVPTNALAATAVATPQSVQRDVLARQAQAAQLQRTQMQQQQALAAARLRLAEARRAQAARLLADRQLQDQRDAAAATRQADRLKSKAPPATATPKL
jgi:hypothetical protein